ncbi:uncharacterized protein PB18E9.04c [Lathyrus oleraceus]|uniref:X8 domain-containing protein n=1 Tax=Pisum sativum TaxID=3888 RepID=A0A9D4YIV5_PEA|nr:uncharacterized protein PB18E9.04c-like [Pisum sativum]KAI5439722.1 hypothetical protein KIW84_025192 [Pisum sativum]
MESNEVGLTQISMDSNTETSKSQSAPLSDTTSNIMFSPLSNLIKIEESVFAFSDPNEKETEDHEAVGRESLTALEGQMVAGHPELVSSDVQMNLNKLVHCDPQDLEDNIEKSPKKIIQSVFQDDAEMVPGHFIQHCPTNGDSTFDIKKVRQPTGIPRSMLMVNPQGSYALLNGSVAVLKSNEAAFDKEMEGLSSTRSVGDLPPELHCPLCNNVMKNAVLTSKCCFKSFCDKCIRDYIMSKSAFVCHATNVLADDLLPNNMLRDAIKRILESGNGSTENAGSTYQVQDMESSRCQQPTIPSPTSSATSKGEPKALPVNEGITNIQEIADERKPVSTQQEPVTNPVTSYPPPSGSAPVPVINPPSNTNALSVQGQSWCVTKADAPQASLQSALGYACGMGADCSQIQQGGSCFSPVTLQSHVSFAFNSYYQKNPAPTSCDFGGAATLINTNPNSGSCIFPSSSSSSSSTPTISSPTPPTQSTPTAIPPPSPITTAPSIQTAPSSIPTVPPTSSGSRTGTFGYGTPPSVLNSSSPDSGAMPDLGSDSPPVVNTTSASHPRALKSSTGCIILMIPFVTARHSMLISQ